ncbi:GNAT family N-acetyltransferase [Amylibacter sp. IMCC11727]|uniref:GNAT family N-acetyltransferase n=1 Tax=Amylibacter sp. IMCC11727 TaxID=3039851 RepID=UPI00244DD919|nr:GNAT family N-acetyltransferase [Amylibacter sp. IMCC11727]WGI21127.1 GNAT family N-acetyltransferase [Amylibacter sp. IMCC11727]
MIVRKAKTTDAAEAISVIRLSISKLCVADHKNDASELSGWLSNKTLTQWVQWLGREDAILLVLEKGNKLLGVGMIDHQGEILLNYVHPDNRLTGVSKTLLTALEEEARALGLTSCFLKSTITAAKFYQSCGYVQGSAARLELEKQL